MLGTTMWATLLQQVDNSTLFTAARTTQLQDVLLGVFTCVVGFRMLFGFAVGHPQSTGLITVINSLSKHPQITMNNICQGARQ
jgi:hypothetical protein